MLILPVELLITADALLPPDPAVQFPVMLIVPEVEEFLTAFATAPLPAVVTKQFPVMLMVPEFKRFIPYP
jgi:hypothetical protein